MAGKGSTTHGFNTKKGRHPIHIAWGNMKQRCLNPKNLSYPHYGGRGITVCEKWKTFENFRDDMLPSWQEGLELDRIDNNGNYEPSNCRWTTDSEQRLNQRPKEYKGNSMVRSFTDSFFGRPSTIRTYLNLFDNHIAPLLGEDDCPKLDDDKIQELVNVWRNDGLAPRTVKSLLQLTNRYHKWTHGRELEVTPLLRKLGRIEQQALIKALTKDEAKKLLDCLEPKHLSLYLICLLGIHAGLRRGEMFGLQYGDIDALRNRIIVQRSYDGPTKSGKPRQVPLSERLAKALERKDYLTQKPTDAIFTSNFDPNPDLKIVCKHLKIKTVTVHDLRHTFATLALESGVSPRTVQSWLGHASLSTTLDIYWSALPTEVRMDFAP